MIISSTCVSSGRWAGMSPGSISFSAVIRKGVWSRLSRRKQEWQIPSFRSISNHRSRQRRQVSICTSSMAALKLCIYPHCSAGRKPAGWTGGGGVGGGGGGGRGGVEDSRGAGGGGGGGRGVEDSRGAGGGGGGGRGVEDSRGAGGGGGGGRGGSSGVCRRDWGI